MVKLIDLLKEINEGKQRGDLYHFTPLSNIISILNSQYLTPNDENAISTSIRPNMATKGFQDMKTSPIARIMLDGNKISNNYKIKPFSYGSEYSEIGRGEDLGEEAIDTNGRNFYFMPYLKRIDIFLNKKPQTNLDKIIKILDKMNIPYKIYEGTPQSNVPYKQPKEGDPSNIKYTPSPKEIIFSTLNSEHPYPNFKSFQFTNNPDVYPLPEDPKELTNKPQYLYRPSTIFDIQWDTTPLFPDHYVHSDSSNSAKFDLENSKSKSEKNKENSTYAYGTNYSNKITQELLKSIKFKTWDEINMSKEIEKFKQEFEKYNLNFGKYGLLFFPKNLADKYLISKQVKPVENKFFVIPKK